MLKKHWMIFAGISLITTAILTPSRLISAQEKLLSQPEIVAANPAQEMVAAHNQWRQKVGVSPLQWSDELANYAQEWANELASTGKFEHRSNLSYGENLFWSSGRNTSPTEVVNSWGSEVKDYDYSTNSCKQVCGHYTQIVWKNTKKVGCGVARSGDEEVWVCNYDPPGNFTGERPY